jgi:AsmA protein
MVELQLPKLIAWVRFPSPAPITCYLQHKVFRMTKALKNTSIVIIVFILFLIVALGALVTLVSPNKFKPLIEAQTFKISGRQLIIDGNLSWSVFPYLGMKMGHAQLSNPPQFKNKNFAEINHATIGVKLMPLLHSAIEFSEITLSGVKFNLIKNADGATNWSNLQKTSVPTASSPAPAPAKKIYSVQIPVLDITDSMVSFDNLQKGQTAQLNHFEFHAKDISTDSPFAITSAFDYAAKNPDVTGHAKLSAKISTDMARALYIIKDIKLSLVTQQKNSKDCTIDISADATADMGQQTLSLTQFIAHIDNLILKGNVNITQLSDSPRAQGHLSAPGFDLKALLQSLGKDNPNLQAAKNVSADFDFATVPAQTSTLENLSINGKIKIAELQAAKLKISNVDIATTMQKGILQITSLTATLYQGNLQSQASVNLLASDTPISFQSKLTNVQAEPLLTDLESQGSKLKVKGMGNIDMKGTTSGLASTNILSNLNGTSTFSFQNGVLEGINLGYLIDSANAFIKGQPAPSKGENVTNFGNLTGTAVIQNGVVTNNDLALISPRFDTKGKGTINLVNQQINYSLELRPKVPGQSTDDKNALNINNLTIPVSVSGDLNNPSINLDMKALGKFIANQQLQKVKDKIGDQIKDKIPGKAGELLKNFLGR